VERLPSGRHGKSSSRGPRGRKITRRTMTCTAMLASATVLAGVVLPSAAGASSIAATQRSAAAGGPSLQTLEARATKLSNQIDSLSEQYDGLKIQLKQAKAEAKAASQTAARDERALKAGRVAVGQIAAEGYMTGGIDPSLELLQGTDPQGLLNRASMLQQLQQENGNKVDLLAAAESAAQRARMAATQELTQAGKLSGQMAKKVSAIQAKENVLNSAAYKKAMEIFQRTKHFPPITIPGDSLGVQALRWAMTKLGSPYVWGAAGPDSFDCSGLVLWSYAHVGISLEHYTGDQWNEGQHISRSQLAPGDLVFFFPDIGHVGMYVGNGLMIDAPTFGQPVQIQPVMWGSYVGAVRIV
jgi:cell wall-associated NlpC family hydrolase